MTAHPLDTLGHATNRTLTALTELAVNRIPMNNSNVEELRSAASTLLIAGQVLSGDKVSACAVVRRPDGTILIGRRSNGKRTILMGGKPEEGEHWLDALTRELDEELGIGSDVTEVRFIGLFPLARGFVGVVYEVTVPQTVHIDSSGEHTDLQWVHPAAITVTVGDQPGTAEVLEAMQ